MADKSWKWYEKTVPSPWEAYPDLSGKIRGYGTIMERLGGRMGELRAQIADYQEIRRGFQGPESIYIRWMLDNKIKQLQAKLATQSDQSSAAWARQELYMAAGERLAGEAAQREEIESRAWASALEPGQERTYPVPGGKERQARIERARGVLGEPRGDGYEPEPPPIPDWMREYLETSMPLPGGMGSAYAMRPMGAQAEIPSERLGQMGGYLGWTKAGAPTEFSEEAITSMQNWPKWWGEYTALSEKLFPTKAKLRSKWYPSSQ